MVRAAPKKWIFIAEKDDDLQLKVQREIHDSTLPFAKNVARCRRARFSEQNFMDLHRPTARWRLDRIFQSEKQSVTGYVHDFCGCFDYRGDSGNFTADIGTQYNHHRYGAAVGCLYHSSDEDEKIHAEWFDVGDYDCGAGVAKSFPVKFCEGWCTHEELNFKPADP